MKGKYVLMPDDQVSDVRVLVPLYGLRKGEWIDGSDELNLRGYRTEDLVYLYPVYASDPREVDEEYSVMRDLIAEARAQGHLINTGETTEEKKKREKHYRMRRFFSEVASGKTETLPAELVENKFRGPTPNMVIMDEVTMRDIEKYENRLKFVQELLRKRGND